MLWAVIFDNGKSSRKLKIKIDYVAKKVNKYICAEDIAPFESTPKAFNTITTLRNNSNLTVLLASLKVLFSWLFILKSYLSKMFPITSTKFSYHAKLLR